MPIAESNDEETAMRAICAGLLLAAGAVHAATGNGLQARDINGDGTVDAYYDVAQNITWLADANYAANFDIGWPAPGQMGSGDALVWATGLNFLGVTGWRLPRSSIGQQCAELLNAGAYTCSNEPPPPDSELNNLELELEGGTSPFLNVQAGPYVFMPTADGYWIYSGQAVSRDGQQSFAWAVHDGDVPHAASAHAASDPPAIPEPSTYALLLAGFTALSRALVTRARGC